MFHHKLELMLRRLGINPIQDIHTPGDLTECIVKR
jgi:hypothetical protein